MKNLSLILNAVLFILVGILFYLHFNGKKSAAPVTVKSLDGKTQAVQGQVIAYFDIDSFQNNYTYYKQKKHEIETKQNAIESEMARDEKKIQSMIEGYQKKAETMTEEEYYIAQQKLAVEQQKAQEKVQNSTDALMKMTEKFNLELMESITVYLKEYNADNRYTYILPYTKSNPNLLYVDERFDITKDIIEGMNAKLKQKK
ncbi:MAG TPA: OmpH family outer membrane protein [Chitinophagales bacterium]|nr:OmpH family outer membrane protein [Chitinophagales bacterium]MCB9074696.1 OmpH family outer membrane protein [Chitinophagales bacterium]HMU97631.1 OmpH family outer membrane protein [Chitinophagales bacterium]HMV01766.1 OmpH family outer membrane protein [Chitinophagales bacterium]HMW94360.1 OmpH family outer membrane protein [Chitinophagales bacterium]